MLGMCTRTKSDVTISGFISFLPSDGADAFKPQKILLRLRHRARMLTADQGTAICGALFNPRSATFATAAVDQRIDWPYLF